MRILMYYPISTWRENGTLTHMVSVADGLGALGHEVLLVTRKPYRPLKGHFRLLAMPPRPFEVKRFGLGVFSRRLLLGALVLLWKPDCIYHRFTLDPAVSAAVNARAVPRVCECVAHATWFREYLVETTATADMRSLLRRQLCEADGLVVFKHSTLRFLVNELNLDSKPLTCVTDGFDPKFVLTHPRRGNPNADGFVVGAVTSGQDYDDLDTLVSAAANVAKYVPPLKLAVVTSQPKLTKLHERALRAGLSTDRVVVHERVQHEHMGEFLGSLDIAVLLFKRWLLDRGDGCESTRFSEFLGAGLCVVASDVPGSWSYPLSQQGIFTAVPPEDPQAVTEVLVRLYRDADLRRRIGVTAQQHAFAERTWMHVVRKIEGVITSAVEH